MRFAVSRPITWLPRLHVIRRSVSNSARSHYERKDLEFLFKLQTAAANKLLGILPTVKVGNGFLVEREALDSFLARVNAADDVPALLAEMKREKGARSRRKLRRLTRYDQEPVAITSLPDWMRISRGRLEVDFETVEQLAEGMFMLAGILLHEMPGFMEAYEPASPVKEQERKALGEMRELFRELHEMELARA